MESNDRRKIINLGVKKLKIMGFVHVNEQNIVEDEVYLYHFRRVVMELMRGSDKDQKSAKQLFDEMERKAKN